MPDNPESNAFHRHAAEARKIARTIYDEDERRIVLTFIEAGVKMFPKKKGRRNDARSIRAIAINADNSARGFESAHAAEQASSNTGRGQDMARPSRPTATDRGQVEEGDRSRGSGVDAEGRD